MIHDSVVHKITRRNPFLQDWPYYARIDILNPVATAQYQHSVTIASKPGMMHDFGDLRFFQADGIEIPFWVESKTDGSTAFVWFKPYSLSLKTVYVFYGNREATSQSNGDKVFDFFDDFLGSALDTTKWGTSGTGSNSVSGSAITISSNNTSYAVSSLPTFGQNTAMRFRGKDTSFAADTYGGFAYQTSGQYFSIQLPWTDYVDKRGYFSSQKTSGSGVFDLGLSDVANYVTYDLIRDSNSALKVYVSGTLKINYTGAQIPDADMSVQISSYTNGKLIYCDWTLVRKYTATEPVCQLNQSGLRNPVYR